MTALAQNVTKLSKDYEALKKKYRNLQAENKKWAEINERQTRSIRNKVKELNRMSVYELAIDSGFMLSTQYGEAEHKLMPVSDGDTLVKFAKAILRKAQEK